MDRHKLEDVVFCLIQYAEAEGISLRCLGEILKQPLENITQAVASHRSMGWIIVSVVTKHGGPQYSFIAHP